MSGDRRKRSGDPSDPGGPRKRSVSAPPTTRKLWDRQLQTIAQEYGKDRNLQIGVPTLEVKIITPFASKQDRSLDSFARLLTDTYPIVCNAIAYDPVQEKVLLSANGTNDAWKTNTTKFLQTLHQISTSTTLQEAEKFRAIIKVLCENNEVKISKLMRESLPKAADRTQIQDFISTLNNDSDFFFLKDQLNRFLTEINKLSRITGNNALDIHEQLKDAYQAAADIANSFYTQLGILNNSNGLPNVALYNRMPETMLEIIVAIDKFRGPIEDLHKVARAFTDNFDWTQHTDSPILIDSKEGIHAESNIMAHVIKELKERSTTGPEEKSSGELEEKKYILEYLS